MSESFDAFGRTRRHVVVDVETTGLALQHQVTEVCWYDLATDEYDTFVAPHTLDDADPVALEMTGYHTRIAPQPVDDGTRTKTLHDRLGGDGAKVTVWGVNPGFDYRNLMALFARAGLDQNPMHHRTLDPCSGAYWMFPHAFAFGETPGLKDVAAFLDIPLPRHHEAMADVLVTVQIIRHMNKIREAQAHSTTMMYRSC